jgi:hypothetical protein
MKILLKIYWFILGKCCKCGSQKWQIINGE